MVGNENTTTGAIPTAGQRRLLHVITATLAITFMVASAVYAQVATTLQQAELAGLSAQKRAEVQSRAVNGNTVTEVLQTILLNSIKAKHPASRIVAMDFGRGIAVVAISAIWAQTFANLVPGIGVRNQYGIETYWNIGATPNSSVTPGVQLIFDPAINPHANFAAVLHLKFRIFS